MLLRLPHVDGRTRAARLYRDVLGALLAERPAPPNAAERELLHRYAALAVQARQLEAALLAGREVDRGQLATIAGVMSRLRRQLDARRARA
jgi:hypothetical protein